MTARWLLLIILLINGVTLYWFNAQKVQRLQLRESGQLSEELPGVEQLQLVRNVPASTRMKTSEQVKSGGQVDERCLVLGPIPEADVIPLKAGLQNVGVALAYWTQEREEISGYWVYLPPFANRQQAQQKLNELQALGVDSFVFETNDLANGISLGMFSNSANADLRKDQLFRMGFRPKVRAATKQVVEHWLAFGLESGSKLAQRFWDDLHKMTTKPEVQEKACHAVASASDFQ